MRAMGLYAGMADLTFILKGNRVGFIELKTPTGRQTEAQRDFEQRVRTMGVPYVICRSLQEVIRTLGHWQERGLL